MFGNASGEFDRRKRLPLGTSDAAGSVLLSSDWRCRNRLPAAHFFLQEGWDARRLWLRSICDILYPCELGA